MKKKLNFYFSRLWGKPIVSSLAIKLLTVLMFIGSMAFSASTNSQRIKTDLLSENSSLTETLNSIEKNGDNTQQPQKKEISGTVKDLKGLPLPGVNVVVKGTTTGTVTDADGRYKILVSTEAKTLVFSFVGMKVQEITLDSNKRIDVTLLEETYNLDEVITVGYGTQKKSDITGAISTIKVEAFKPIPLTRADQVLQGLVAGLDVKNTSGGPNAETSIRIRGISSIGGGSDPLVVVDGVQGVSLNDVNPRDIKSVEVLKDASATAIYGSRGASGVILITTYQGTVGRPVLTYSGFMKVGTLRKKLDFLNAGQFAKYANPVPPFTEEDIQKFQTQGGTDWQDEIFQTSYSQNHHITISGGDKNVTYNLSGDYQKGIGLIICTSYEQYTLRPNISVNVTDKLKVAINMFLSGSNGHPDTGDRFSAAQDNKSVVFNAWLFPPTWPVYNPDGKYSQPQRSVGSAVIYNPVAMAREQINDVKTHKAIISPEVEYKIMEGLKVQLSGSYQLIETNNSFYRTEKINNGTSLDRQASIDKTTASSYQNTNLISYEKTLNKHGIGLTAVYETQVYNYEGTWISTRDFLTNSVTYNNLALGESPARPYSANVSTALQSFMGRINYSYAGKYLLTLTGRSDASSVFGANNKQAFFPSAAASWNVSKESFLVNSKSISNLKLRISYGKVGNQAISPFQSLAKFSNGVFGINGSTQSTTVKLSYAAPNPDLKWETTNQANIGTDLGLFKDRITVTADYYNKTTDNLLLNRPVPQATGFATKLVNIGSVENKGIELAIQGKPINNQFVWSTGIVYSRNRNKVLRLIDEVKELSLGGTLTPGTSNTIWLEVGQPMGIIRTLEYAGVWKSWEAEEAAKYGAVPGQSKYVDQNKDGKLDFENDLKDVGHTQPKYTFGWNNTFNYKGFDLNVLIQGVQGNDIYYTGRMYLDNGISTRILRAWTPENENTDVAKLGIYNFNPSTSSQYIEDGSYIRFKNISLGYNLPLILCHKLGIGSVQISLAGTNLITITKYSGYDPEGSSQGVDAFGGIDFGVYPSEKSLTLGLNLKF